MSENGTNLLNKKECAILQPTITPEDLLKQLAIIESQIAQARLIEKSTKELSGTVRTELQERKSTYAGGRIPVDPTITKLSDCQLAASESSRIGEELLNTLLELKTKLQSLLADFETNTTTDIER